MSIKQKTRFILYGHGRTGSSLLGRYINQHPDACFGGELYHFNNLKNLSAWKKFLATHIPRMYLRRKVNSCEESCFGFSFLFYQFVLARTSVEKMNEWGWKIIHLKRDNILDQVLSNQVAHLRKKWHASSDDAAQEESQSGLFEVDKEDALNRLIYISNANKEQQNSMNAIPHFSVHYENDLKEQSQHQYTLNKVFDFLELDRIRLDTPDLLKTFNKPYSEIVSNYDEVKIAAIKSGLIENE